MGEAEWVASNPTGPEDTGRGDDLYSVAAGAAAARKGRAARMKEVENCMLNCWEWFLSWSCSLKRKSDGYEVGFICSENKKKLKKQLML